MKLFNLRHLRHQDTKEETIITPEPKPTGNTLIFLYHSEDREFWYDLKPHINTLDLRLQGLFEWKYYNYPINPNPENKHEEFIDDLQHGLLFLPCTSANFLTQYLQSSKKDPRIPEALTKLYVQPIPLKAAHGVSQSIIPKPLAAYEKGHLRDEACVQIIQAIEAKLLQHIRLTQRQFEQTPITIEETNTTRLLAAPSHR